MGRRHAAFPLSHPTPAFPLRFTTASRFTVSNRTGWLMAGPAVALIATCVILPFRLCHCAVLTNQRLVSPNPTEFVGLSTYRQLLGVTMLTLDPLRNDAGAMVMKDGQPEYPSLRARTRNNPDRPDLAGMRERFSFSLGGESRT
jgi:multiple sugar transport system permease protein